jgi:hypothetical protein
MDGTNMSVSTYPMYGISKPFAALSCSQVLSLCNLSFGSKFLLKNDSVMVLTIEPVSKRQVTIIPAPVYASQAKSGENSDLSKVLADLTSEMESIKTEVQTLKRERQQKQQRKFTKVDKDFICYNCGKPGHIKQNCRSQSRDLNKDNLLQRADQWVQRKN